MDKKKKMTVYCLLLLFSIIAFVLLYLFDARGMLGYFITLFTFYIFLGSIIKLCRLSEKFKNAVINFIDSLF